MKRFCTFIIPLTLVLVLCLLLLPTHAQAATPLYSGTCGDGLIWTLDDESALTISGTGIMASNTYIGSYYVNASGQYVPGK